MTAPLVGRAVRRVEDARFLRGRGCYIDDLRLPGLLHAAFVRSPHANARLLAIDSRDARSAEGVVEILDGPTVRGSCRPIRAVITTPGLVPSEWPVLALDRVRFAGEAVAVVIADSPYRAADAAERVVVEYEPLPALTDVASAAGAGATLLHDGTQTNVLYQRGVTAGDVDGAFARADLVISETFQTQRATGVPIEPRGAIAAPDERTGGLTLWSSTQVPHILRTALAELLALDEARLRVVAPDVGGGFGVKGQLFPEEAVLCVAARRVGRPVKWVETRREHLLASIHSREHRYEVEAAFSREGRLLALRGTVDVDAGAYSVYPYTISTEPAHAASLLPGPYDVQNYACDARGIVTNKCPIAPYRGVSRPTANFVTERLMDMAARRLALDPAEIRLRNLIRDDQFPYRTATGPVFDSGQYASAVRRALEAAGYADFRARQAAARARGRYPGIGLSIYVETSAGGSSSFLARGMSVAGFDMSVVRVLPSGRAEVFTSAASQGQSHETVFAQLVADVLALPLEHVIVSEGDTQLVPYGTGTFGSRSAVMSGGAAILAARQVRDKAVRVAAYLLEAAAADVILDDRGFAVRGAESRRLGWPDVARAAYIGTSVLPREIQRGLEATAVHDLPAGQMPCSYGVHVVVVEIDPDTGRMQIMRYVVIEDCGTVLNPMVVEGQIHGAFAQGLGTATAESLVYDDAGQLLTATLMDYAVPRADGVPAVELHHLVTPSPFTLTGAKGMAEGASVAPPAALANAVSDALAPFGVEITTLPLTPERIRTAFLEGKRAS
jgi:aerobic carbon-monoxide dehydrogenase large subunit